MKITLHNLAASMAALLMGGGLLLDSGIARAGPWDQYNDAERSAKDLLYSYEDFLKMEKRQIEELVTAIANAEEDERRSIASDAASRTRDKVRADFDKVERRRNESLAMLDKALANPVYKDKHSDARNLKSQVEDKWRAIDRMYDKVRGSNHPVVAFMLDKGKEEHDYRQGRCTVKEFQTGDGPADCIGYDGDSCLIVEFKPDNSRSISRGKDQLSRYLNAISSNSSRRQELGGKHSSFAGCTKFQTRVDCYRLTPEIDNEGNFRSTSASWRTGC
jgi:hypothetical protein